MLYRTAGARRAIRQAVFRPRNFIRLRTIGRPRKAAPSVFIHFAKRESVVRPVFRTRNGDVVGAIVRRLYAFQSVRRFAVGAGNAIRAAVLGRRNHAVRRTIAFDRGAAYAVGRIAKRGLKYLFFPATVLYLAAETGVGLILQVCGLKNLVRLAIRLHRRGEPLQTPQTVEMLYRAEGTWHAIRRAVSGFCNAVARTIRRRRTAAPLSGKHFAKYESRKPVFLPLPKVGMVGAIFRQLYAFQSVCPLAVGAGLAIRIAVLGHRSHAVRRTIVFARVAACAAERVVVRGLKNLVFPAIALRLLGKRGRSRQRAERQNRIQCRQRPIF